MSRLSALFAPLSVVLVGLTLRAADANPVYDIPKLADVKIDGKGDDWGDKGFKVENLCDVAGRARALDNFQPSFRLGWNEQGLLVLVTVADDIALEPAEKPEDLWQGDSIEFFVSTERGGDASYQVVVAPGRDPKKPELRSNLSDYRKSHKKEKLTIEAQRSVSDKGYVIEVLLPWKNLELEPKDGLEIAFQLYANDVDKENERFQALWYPKPDAHSDTHNTHRLRLSESKTSPPVLAAAAANYDGDGKGLITLVAAASFAGQPVSLKDGDKTVGESKFESDGGRAVAKFTLPKPEQAYAPLTAQAGADVLGIVVIPEAAK